MFDSEIFEFRPESCDRVARTDEDRSMVDFPAETAAGVPAGLDEMEPGPFLSVILSTIDPNTVSGYDRVEVLRARERLVSHNNAGFYGVLASISDYMFELDGDLAVADEAAAYEVRSALRLTRRTADNEIDLANVLSSRLPQVGQALADGKIDLRRARVISYGTSHLDADTARQVVDMVISDASRLTSGQLHARIRKHCFEADPEETKNRYEAALEERKVVKEANTTGTANLFLTDLPPDQAAEAYAHINAIALSLTGDGRSIDQRRADVALDLLTGQRTHKRTGKAASTFPSTSKHWPNSTMPLVNWPGMGLSSPTSPAKSANNNKTPNGGSSSPTPTPDSSSTTAPPNADTTKNKKDG